MIVNRTFTDLHGRTSTWWKTAVHVIMDCLTIAATFVSTVVPALLAKGYAHILEFLGHPSGSTVGAVGAAMTGIVIATIACRWY
jgi:uncharacterized membrane protein